MGAHNIVVGALCHFSPTFGLLTTPFWPLKIPFPDAFPNPV